MAEEPWEEQVGVEQAETHTLGLRVCDYTDYTGNCVAYSTRDFDLSGNTWCSGCSTVNDDISSLHLEPGYAALLCQHAYFGGGCRYFGANSCPSCYWSLANFAFDNGVSMNQRTSSFEIYQEDWATFWNSFSYQSNYPHDRQNVWSDNAQGLAHDGANWYITDQNDIFKYPVGTAIGSNDYVDRASLPSGCDHFGDPDYYAGVIYVPLEGCGSPSPQRVYVYDTNLNVLRWAALDGNGHAAWAAVNPTNGLLHTSASFYDVTRIQVYSRSFASGAAITPLYEITLPATYRRIQGGAFSQAGHLYLVSDDVDNPSDAGIYTFRVRGSDATQMRYIHPNGFDTSDEELEGITIWNLDEVPGKHASVAGHIHWLLLDNDWPDDDDVFGKHIRVDDPAHL